MEWTECMRKEEVALKGLVDKLGSIHGNGLRSRVERIQLTRALTRDLSRIRSFLDDCLGGRNSYERYLMEYRVRVEFPLFSHLESIFSMSEGVLQSSDCA